MSRTTGETVYVFEFKAAKPADLSENLMNSIETWIANLIVQALHKSSPGMTAADDATVTKAVTDFVTTGMDLASVYFALRAAKKCNVRCPWSVVRSWAPGRHFSRPLHHNGRLTTDNGLIRSFHGHPDHRRGGHSEGAAAAADFVFLGEGS